MTHGEARLAVCAPDMFYNLLNQKYVIGDLDNFKEIAQNSFTRQHQIYLSGTTFSALDNTNVDFEQHETFNYKLLVCV